MFENSVKIKTHELICQNPQSNWTWMVSLLILLRSFSISVNSGFRSINLAAYIQLLFTSNVKCGTKYLRSSRKRCVPQDSWSCSWKKIIETFIGFFLPLSTEIKYVHTVACTVVFVGPVGFVFSAYPERNATSPLSSCSNKNDGHAVALTVFLRLLLKEPFV